MYSIYPSRICIYVCKCVCIYIYIYIYISLPADTLTVSMNSGYVFSSLSIISWWAARYFLPSINTHAIDSVIYFWLLVATPSVLHMFSPFGSIRCLYRRVSTFRLIPIALIHFVRRWSQLRTDRWHSNSDLYIYVNNRTRRMGSEVYICHTWNGENKEEYIHTSYPFCIISSNSHSLAFGVPLQSLMSREDGEDIPAFLGIHNLFLLLIKFEK